MLTLYHLEVRFTSVHGGGGGGGWQGGGSGLAENHSQDPGTRKDQSSEQMMPLNPWDSEEVSELDEGIETRQYWLQTTTLWVLHSKLGLCLVS